MTAENSSDTPRHIVIGGGSGFIGSALSAALRARGDRVTLISRQAGPGRITWDALERDGLPACDAVVNLAGRHILDPRRRWTERYRDEVIRSRVETTTLLVNQINEMTEPPAVFISTAGKCFYGTEAGAAERRASYPELDEDSAPMGLDFPAELVGRWEKAADHLDATRVRHVRLRIGIVLGSVEREGFIAKLWRIGRSRGLLPLIRLPFCMGLGAVIGTGHQPFPWVHIDDMVGIVLKVIDDESAAGRYNCVAPGIVDNRTFMSALARHLRRPLLWRAPAWLVTGLVGAERASILLEGQNVVPRRTIALGYDFRFPTLEPALTNLVRITF